MQDSKGIPINCNDIVVCNNHRVGFVWTDRENKMFVAWDLEGPSCEDSSPIEDFMGKYDRIKVVGKLNE